MVYDILIAIGIGASQIALTWYAVYISVKKNKSRHAKVIFSIGLVGLLLTIGATIRSSNILAEIQQNTQRQATIKIQPLPDNKALPEPLATTHPLRLNFWWMDIGNESARNLRQFSHVYL